VKTFLFCFLLLQSIAAPAPIVELTIKERAGIARQGEPITVGVPLPSGLITDTASLALTDTAGNRIDCEFRKAGEWLKNTSLRWVHLDFQASVPESGSVKVVLHQDASKHAVTDSRLTVTDLGAKIEVSTGLIKFTVKKSNYNVIDEAWVDETGAGNYAAKQVVAAHSRGLSGFWAGAEYLSSNDAASTTIVERKGPMAVVLKSTGFLKSTASAQLFRFVCRLYAYNQSATLKFVYSFENNRGVTDSTSLQSLDVDIPTTLAASPTFFLGAPLAAKIGTLSSASDTAYCLASNAYNIAGNGSAATVNYAFGGRATGSGQAMNSMTHLRQRHLGWAALSDGAKGLAFTVRDFWQTNPTSVEVYGDGLCRIGLYPRLRNGDYGDIAIYGGHSRTHEMRFVFLGSGATEQAICEQIGGMQAPLMAMAPPAWYCSGTLGYTRLTERDYTKYHPKYKTWVQSLDNRMTSSFLMQDGYFDRFSREGVSLDAYGFLDWGSTFHWAWTVGLYDPTNISWDGQYYGLDDVYFVEFLRSGDLRWFDAFESQERGHMDLQIGHFGPGAGSTGACRYCPSRDHARQDEGNLYISGECNHHKNSGLFQRWYLCADERSRDVAMETVDWALRDWPTTYQSVSQIRGPAFYCMMLMEAYLYTKQQNYLTNVGNTVNYHIDYYNTTANKSFFAFSQFDWLGSFFAEAAADYNEVSPTVKVQTFFRDLSSYTQLYKSPRWAMANAYAYKLFKDTLYLGRAVECMKVNPALPNLFKDFASEYRSMSRGTFYIKDTGLTSVEKKFRVPLSDRLSLSPNPFNPDLAVRYWRNSVSDVQIRIFDADGRLVKALAPPSGNWQPGWNQVTWKGEDQSGQRAASGVYLLQVMEGKNLLTRKVMLAK
jgi:hypothetical protein